MPSKTPLCRQNAVKIVVSYWHRGVYLEKEMNHPVADFSEFDNMEISENCVGGSVKIPVWIGFSLNPQPQQKLGIFFRAV
jgi:hypothetical protein